ncbi:MAG: hypothetical protein FJ260_08250 [Planctomycetes bacterium]|nr:hypothetical protein [Planctomycetota bacterium]
MNANLFYLAAALGAVVLYLMMEPRPAPFRAALTVFGLAAVALILTAVAANAPAPEDAASGAPFGLHVLLSLVAVAGAARMVTHPKPVYAALYFILVILAVAVNFLLMQAEFMAFALLIVYAGAILITYLFVLMLAQQSGDRGSRGEDASWYDRTPREPIAALILAFIVLATTGDALFRRPNALPWVASPAETARANVRLWEQAGDMPGLLADEARAVALADLAKDPGLAKAWSPANATEQAAREAIAAASVAIDGGGRRLSVSPDGASATVTLRTADGTLHPVKLDAAAAPSNSQSLGHSLVAKFPVSLELAGVILLMALFGAVVLARKQMQMAEDERRIAAGVQRLGDESFERGGAA